MTTLTDILSENHYPLELASDVLTGPGAEFLHAQARACRFMLIGEEHGVGSNVDFSTALFQALQPLGYTQYVTEIGPASAEYFNQLVRKPDAMAAFRAFYTQYPFSVPFAWLEEEVHLLKAVAAANSAGGIIGIDQEFVFSPQLHLDTLLKACPDPAWQAQLTAWLDLERDANRALASGTTPDQLTAFMNVPLPEGWHALREYFASQQNSEAVTLMDALEASHQLYMHYAHEEYYDNNHVRSQLMRKYFYAAYQKIIAAQPDARFLVKLGANHISRGHSTMGIQDIGNFISELATMHETQSFHLFVLPISGTQNAWLPFLPAEFKTYPIDSDYGPMFQPFLDAAPAKTGWNLYDLRPLRHRQMRWSKDNPAFLDLFLRYDAILIMENVRAAQLVVP